MMLMNKCVLMITTDNPLVKPVPAARDENQHTVTCAARTSRIVTSSRLILTCILFVGLLFLNATAATTSREAPTLIADQQLENKTQKDRELSADSDRARSSRIEVQRNKRDQQLQAKNTLLLREQSQLESQEDSHNRAALKFTVTIVAVLLLLLGLTYRGYKTKQQGNVLLQKKQNEIAEKNTALEHLLAENEWLLKEVHHRVKNNLQMITALLNSQSAYLKDPLALDAIMESRRRVQSMVLIHQKLYRASNYSSIFMPDYIQELLAYLKDSFDSGSAIFFSLDIAPVSLDIASALPVGMIVNEAVTNAIKHAFPHPFREERLVTICLQETAGETCLRIADNGKGLPADFDGTPKSFGVKLMRGLTDEMSGKFIIKGGQGTIVEVSFSSTVAVHSSHLIPS
jgi:two-component sensor histidine kinase